MRAKGQKDQQDLRQDRWENLTRPGKGKRAFMEEPQGMLDSTLSSAQLATKFTQYYSGDARLSRSDRLTSSRSFALGHIRLQTCDTCKSEPGLKSGPVRIHRNRNGLRLERDTCST